MSGFNDVTGAQNCLSDATNRPLSSLSMQEIQHVLNHHNMPSSVKVALLNEHVDGPMVNLVQSIDAFTELGVKIIHAARLLDIFQQAQRSGIPISWLQDVQNGKQSLVASQQCGVQEEILFGPVELAVHEEDALLSQSQHDTDNVDPGIVGDVAEGQTVAAATGDGLSRTKAGTLGPVERALLHHHACWSEYIFGWHKCVEELRVEDWDQAYDQFYQACYKKLAPAIEWLEQQSASGNNAARAYLMLRDYGWKLNRQRARTICAELNKKTLSRWLKSSNAKEKMHAQYIQGSCNFYGLGCTRDYKKAFTQFQKSAEGGHAQVQYMLGRCYYYGYGVGKSPEVGIAWWERAAAQGHVLTQQTLGRCYFHGYGMSAPMPEKGLYWWTRAAEQDDAQSQFQLGQIYSNGEGVEADREQGLAWYQRAAERGHAESQYILGRRYRDGHLVAEDKVRAADWFRRAAAQGHNEAALMLQDLGEV